MAEPSRFPNLRLVDHPLIQHKLTLMRERTTPTALFRTLLREIAVLMTYEVTRDLPRTTRRVETPRGTVDGPAIAGKKLVVVPILRAGLGMADGLFEVIPSARVGHIGLYRDETTKLPVEYLVRLPDMTGRQVILVDPMLATGNSASFALDLLNRHGVDDARIRFMGLLAAPEGVDKVALRHPTVPLYVAALDDRLDEEAFIVPGLGDAGDRLFGTL
ncbi:MAG TPA: uracil phosphoribosyltransferase [Alphaproteobacteria bacterium]|jgi:uracil phosphoribosyltransferase|nr:uracil phosphoribosyltransferase [Alphaproteobacteria bacterium]